LDITQSTECQVWSSCRKSTHGTWIEKEF